MLKYCLNDRIELLLESFLSEFKIICIVDGLVVYDASYSNVKDATQAFHDFIETHMKKASDYTPLAS